MFEVNIVSAWEDICHSSAHSFDRRTKKMKGGHYITLCGSLSQLINVERE